MFGHGTGLPSPGPSAFTDAARLNTKYLLFVHFQLEKPSDRSNTQPFVVTHVVYTFIWPYSVFGERGKKQSIAAVCLLHAVHA